MLPFAPVCAWRSGVAHAVSPGQGIFLVSPGQDIFLVSPGQDILLVSPGQGIFLAQVHVAADPRLAVPHLGLGGVSSLPAALQGGCCIGTSARTLLVASLRCIAVHGGVGPRPTTVNGVSSAAW